MNLNRKCRIEENNNSACFRSIAIYEGSHFDSVMWRSWLLWLGSCDNQSIMSEQVCRQLTEKHIEYAQYSGHFFGQMGDYYDCVDLPYDSSYFMANLINNKTRANATLFLGLCLPSVCPPQYIENTINEKLAIVEPVIQQLFGFPLAVGSMEVNPQDYTWDKSGWFYLTMVLLSLFVVLGIAALWRSLRGQRREKYSTPHKMLQAFSYAQSMKIFVYKHNYLNIFNGIKTFSMFWVIFGHLFSVRLKYDVNIAGIPGIVEEFFFTLVTGGFLAVDVFFFIGGFLVAYSFMREKSKSLLKYPMAILHRVLRFWPSYIMIILLYYSVQIHVGSGPLWKENNTLGQIPYCSGAWKSLLFVDNLVDNGQSMCMPWGWYLQNDMQIFIFSMIFIMIYSKHRIAGYICIGGMLCLGLGLNIYEVIHREIKQVTHLIDFVKWQEYFTNIYIKPWIRCPPYLLGLFLGLLHMEYVAVRKQLKDEPENQKLKNNFFIKMRDRMLLKRWVAWISQLLGIALMITTVVVPHDMQLGNTWPYWAHGIYLSLEKVSFTFGVYLLVLPSILEVPNLAFFLLDTKFFNFTGKISFWVYLIHFMIVERVCFGEKVDFYYTPETIIPLFFAVAIISMMLGFVGTLLVQVPFSKLEKMMFGMLMKKKEIPPQVKNPESVIGSSSIVESDTSSIAIPNNSTVLTSESLEERLIRPDDNRTSIQHDDE